MIYISLLRNSGESWHASTCTSFWIINWDRCRDVGNHENGLLLGSCVGWSMNQSFHDKTVNDLSDIEFRYIHTVSRP